MSKLTIGYNPAANMLPVFYFLNRQDPALEFITGTPAEHNRLMAEGKIDAAPISAFSFGQHWEKYSVLADLSVSAKGPIGSILLYSKLPLEELDRRKVALTNTSATSVNLLRIILAEFYHVKPIYMTMPPHLESMLAEADAALLIADEALMGLAKNTGCLVYDLSSEWHKHTGLSMTFSVWAVANHVIKESPAEVARFHRQLLEAKQQGYAHTYKIIDHCMTNLGADYQFWAVYFSQLRHDLTSELLEGLRTYFKYCVALGLLPTQPQINIWP